MAIIVREGLEAVLIIGVILGYLRSSGSPARFSWWVTAGIVAAVLLSLLTWWLARTVIDVTAANREVIEGVTSLVAVAVLFYVTNWIFHKTYVVEWMSYVRAQVGRAVSNGSALVLAGLGFTVVYREGFETVLFYQALLFDAEPGPVIAGFIAGALIIAVVAFAILRMSARLPIKRFFSATGVLLLLMALSLTGSGIRELQEAGVVDATLLDWVPENVWLMEVFGIFPTVETTVAQALLLVALAATFSLSVWRKRRAVTRPAAA